MRGMKFIPPAFRLPEAVEMGIDTDILIFNRPDWFHGPNPYFLYYTTNVS
jgi:hypothetical protein